MVAATLLNLHYTNDLSFLFPHLLRFPPDLTAFPKAATTQQLNTRKLLISTFVNYVWKNRPVVFLCDNGASTTEGLPPDNTYAELTNVTKAHVVGNN